MSFMYKFPAVTGIQANQNYYIAMVPLKLLEILFRTDADISLPEYRSQRRINEFRIPEIKDYILNNRNNYVFSALAASIDGEFKFNTLNSEFSNIGILEIDMSANFLINDGQHRLAAIKEAIKEDLTLVNETISIVFFKDEGLARSQQMFTDLNKHAVKTSNSLANLYDSRDQIAVYTRNIISENRFLNLYTDKEKDILGKNSSKLFTLNNIYKANKKILKNGEMTEDDYSFLKDFWELITNNIAEWQDLLNKNIAKKDLRENYITTLAVTISAFGRLGSYFYENKDVNMKEKLSKLRKINWCRGCSENWLGRTIREDGKIKNNEEAVFLTCNKIKMLLGIDLTEEEQCKENYVKKKEGRNG